MEFPYPDTESITISLTTITLHLALLITAIAPIVLLFWQRKRAARVSDAWIFLTCVVAAPGILLANLENINQHSRPFIIGYFLLFEVVSIAALVSVTLRLRNDGRKTSALGTLAFLLYCGFLIALLLPSVPSAREAAKRTQCANNLKQLGLGLHNYFDTYRTFPCPIGSKESQIPVSWRVSLTPFLELEAESKRYRFDQPWDSSENTKLAKEYFPTFSCPSWESKPVDSNGSAFVTDDDGNALTAFSIPIGEKTFFGDGKSTRDPSDAVSTSSTIMIVESTGQNIVWTEPRDVNTDRLPVGINLPGKRKGWSQGIMSSHHPDYVQVTMLDGSVNGFSKETDPDFLRALLSGRADHSAPKETNK